MNFTTGIELYTQTPEGQGCLMRWFPETHRLRVVNGKLSKRSRAMYRKDYAKAFPNMEAACY